VDNKPNNGSWCNGCSITISGKLRGDRSAFEKHTQGILPRAGNYAKNIVSEDIVHTKTPMGLIGIKIRIAQKERIIPEFELGEVLTVKTEDKKDEKDMAATETEQIKIEEEKMKTLETLEEEEESLK